MYIPHMQFTTVQCIIRFLWGSARIGAGANAAEGILSPQIQFASPEPTASVSQSGIWIVSERQRCLRMVRDGCGGR